MPDFATIGAAANTEQAGAGANGNVVGAIRQASNESGVDFSYLLQKASTESGLNPNAHAATSSASGLFQFIDQTWLTEISQHGAQYGLGGQALAVSFDTNGRAHVDDPAMRREIMAEKNDPKIASEMAAEFTKDNQAALSQSVGGKIGSTELYLAHFLGAGGAAKFINAFRKNSGAAADSVVPAAADSNEAVFYHADGSARSLGEIYHRFAAKFSGTPEPVTAPSTSSYAAYANAYTAARSAVSSFSAGYTAPAFAVNTPSTNSTAGTVNDTSIGNEGRASLYEMLLLSQLAGIKDQSAEVPLSAS